MRSRSRMAVWGIVAMLVLLSGASSSGDEKPGRSASVQNTVQLDLQLSGIGPQGGHIEIRPAHPSSRFEPIVREIQDVSADGVVRLGTIAIDARSLNADRDCAFSITIKAPGAEDQTFKRSVRLLPQQADAPVPVRSMTCYLRTVVVVKKDMP
ncbi:hypothetical protein BH23PLA1_BH23PLA1_16000 [soil metagenome]